MVGVTAGLCAGTALTLLPAATDGEDAVSALGTFLADATAAVSPSSKCYHISTAIFRAFKQFYRVSPHRTSVSTAL